MRILGWIWPMRPVLAMPLWAMAAICLAPALNASPALAAPDAGMVISLAGGATYSSDAEGLADQPVAAFMKLRQGDRLVLESQAAIELLFRAPPRKETWRGPGILSIEAEGVRPSRPDLRPQVKAMPGPVAAALGETALPLPRNRYQRGGVIVVRGGEDAQTPDDGSPYVPAPDEMEQIRRAWRAYEEMKGGADGDAMVAELYLLSVLARFEQFEDMGKALGRLESTGAAPEAVANMRDWMGKNHPARIRLYLLAPDAGCVMGPQCYNLGNMGAYRKSQPFPPESADEMAAGVGDILTFAVSNTTNQDLYLYMINIAPDNGPELIFPGPDDSAAASRVPSRGRLDLFTDAGVGLMPERAGTERVRFYLSPDPLSPEQTEALKTAPPASSRLNMISAAIPISGERVGQ